MKFLPVLIISCLLGVLLLVRFMSAYQQAYHFRDGQKITLEVTLASEPKTTSRSQQFSVRKPGFDTIFVHTALFPEYRYGDKLRLSGTLKEKVIEGDRRIMTLSYPKVTQLETEYSLLVQSKRRITDLFATTLPPIPASLLSGIVFGTEEQMPKDFLDKLRVQGLTHIIAASGMNVSFVAAALLFMGSQIFHRKVTLGLAIVGIGVYCVLTGLEPSIMRATIMGIIAYIAALLGRQQLACISLVITAWLMLMINPFVIADLGFQLSFLATIGIVYLKPVLGQAWVNRQRNVIAIVFKEDITTTMAAQLITFPLLFATFGSFNLFSFISNLLVLWTIPFIMILGGLGALLGLFVPLLGQVCIFLSLPFLWYFQAVVELGSQFSFLVESTHVSWLFAIGWYGILLAIAFIKQHEKTA